MNIIIVGGGVVGFSLAEHLLRENHNLVLIERDQQVYQNINERLDAKVICGHGSSPRILELAGIDNADMMIAVSPNDELNITICAVARQYGVPTRIARIRSNEFRGENANIDISAMGVTLVIDPESVVVDSITQFVETPFASDAYNFHDGNILMRGYRVTKDMPISGKTLFEIGIDTQDSQILFIAAIRDGKGFIPDGKYTVSPGDDIFGIFARSEIDTYLGYFNINRKDTSNVIISGNTLTSILLAEELKSFVNNVTLIDPDPMHAEMAARRLNNVEVIKGDSTDSSILREVYVRNANFFIATSRETDFNVMSSLLALAEGAKEVIAISAEVRHDELFRSIGINHIIHPRLAIAQEILEAINRGHIGRITRIRDLNIEAIRITNENGSPITGQSLQEFGQKMPKGTIIAAILRDDDMIIPSGSSVISANDQVIVVTYSKNISRVKKLFKAR